MFNCECVLVSMLMRIPSSWPRAAIRRMTAHDTDVTREVRTPARILEMDTEPEFKGALAFRSGQSVSNGLVTVG